MNRELHEKAEALAKGTFRTRITLETDGPVGKERYYYAENPDFNTCGATGSTWREALKRLEEARRDMIAYYLEVDRAIPTVVADNRNLRLVSSPKPQTQEAKAHKNSDGAATIETSQSEGNIYLPRRADEIVFA
nr:hypothetical protein Hi04_10k_c2089_00011 [uncultured bacterium]